MLLHVSSLPMRNWNRDTVEAHVADFEYPAYLWGIETVNLVVGPTVLSVYPAYLWGIETSIRLHMVSSGLWVSSLPMRNWNIERFDDALNYIAVSSLPMRNWNIMSPGLTRVIVRIQPTYEELKLIYDLAVKAGVKCIQPTYEELKRNASRWVAGTSPGIQPTYEELKLFSSPAVQRIQTRIQPTYEELKLKNIQKDADKRSIQPTYEELKPCNLLPGCCITGNVSSLPMRNWNTNLSF